MFGGTIYWAGLVFVGGVVASLTALVLGDEFASGYGPIIIGIGAVIGIQVLRLRRA